jgi:hypothetical protein
MGNGGRAWPLLRMHHGTRAGSFVGSRCRINYPIYGTLATMTFDEPATD